MTAPELTIICLETSLQSSCSLYPGKSLQNNKSLATSLHPWSRIQNLGGGERDSEQSFAMPWQPSCQDRIPILSLEFEKHHVWP